MSLFRVFSELFTIDSSAAACLVYSCSSRASVANIDNHLGPGRQKKRGPYLRPADFAWNNSRNWKCRFHEIQRLYNCRRIKPFRRPSRNLRRGFPCAACPKARQARSSTSAGIGCGRDGGREYEKHRENGDNRTEYDDSRSTMPCEIRYGCHRFFLSCCFHNVGEETARAVALRFPERYPMTARVT